MFPFATLAVVLALMLLEAALSRRHERLLRARGAVEPHDDVYRWMQPAYPAAFVLVAVEGALRGAPGAPWWQLGLSVFVAAKALKYWAMAALGERWTFRLLVLQGRPLVTSGPYRHLRHPNYVAVVGEFVGAACLLGAPVAGGVACVGFGALILRRINVEEQALQRK